MNAVETIEAAIVRLEELKGNGKPWVMAGGNEWINPIGITVAPDDGGVSSREADLIVTLHRTIDAQLAILRHALEESNNYIYRDGWRLVDNDAAVLAEAILWGNE